MELDSPRLHVLPLKLARKMLSDSVFHAASLVPPTAAPSPRCQRQHCPRPAHPYLSRTPAARWGPVDQGLAGATAGTTTQGQDHLGVSSAGDRAPESPAHRAHVGSLAAGTAGRRLGMGEHSEHQAAPTSLPALPLIPHHASSHLLRHHRNHCSSSRSGEFVLEMKRSFRFSRTLCQ